MVSRTLSRRRERASHAPRGTHTCEATPRAKPRARLACARRFLNIASQSAMMTRAACRVGKGAQASQSRLTPFSRDISSTAAATKPLALKWSTCREDSTDIYHRRFKFVALPCIFAYVAHAALTDASPSSLLGSAAAALNARAASRALTYICGPGVWPRSA